MQNHPWYPVSYLSVGLYYYYSSTFGGKKGESQNIHVPSSGTKTRAEESR